MNVDVLAKILERKFINEGKDRKIKEFKIDSRLLNKGDAFIAIIGNNTDGHKYIEEAIKKKVSVLIVSKKIKLKTNIPIILVADTNIALMKIAAFFRNKYDMPVIGVTGSVGKTTTKEIISDILSKKYNVLKSEKNYNNHIGVPLTLLKLNNEYDICVLEMGMNHLGEISKLSKIARPTVGVITNIGTAHIGNLGSKKNILKAKMEIIDGMEEKNLVINGQDRLLKKIKKNKDFKYNEKLTPYDIKVTNRVSFKLKIDNDSYCFDYDSLNTSLVMNFVLAIQIGLLFNISVEDIKEAISNYKMPKERMNVIIRNTTKIIDDCYNASLESVLSSMNVLKYDENNRKIIILGDILELGKHTIKIHKKVGRHLKKLKNADVLLIGKYVKNIKNKKYKYFNNTEELIKHLQGIDISNTTILIKGSRKMQLEKVAEFLVNT